MAMPQKLRWLAIFPDQGTGAVAGEVAFLTGGNVVALLVGEGFVLGVGAS